MIEANFTVEWPGGRQEYPYRNAEQYAEQKARALEHFERAAAALEPGDLTSVTLTRLSIEDLKEGEYAPTLLRNSADPSYAYDGFPEAWERVPS